MPCDALDFYTQRIIEDIKLRGAHTVRPVMSLYMGGGTPSLLGGRRIADIVNAAKEAFKFCDGAEITLEANPADDLYEALLLAKEAGVNRLSLGMQTAVQKELSALGRRHKHSDVIKTVQTARKVGIDNISLDLMLGIPYQTADSLDKSISAALSLNPEHISAYLLSVEEDTPLYSSPDRKFAADEDTCASFYEQLCNRLKNAGYEHYEISNFSKKGKYSRHNTNYWKCGEYLGFGPSAHSAFEGKRFYVEADIDRYFEKTVYIDDGKMGGLEERVMLGLRLSDGINLTELKIKQKPDLSYLENSGYIKCDGDRISLTEKGMLLSNSVICEIINLLEDEL